jgi:hypothetical protein
LLSGLHGQVVLLKDLLLEGVLLPGYDLTLVDILSVAADSGVAGIIQLLMPEGCVACHLALYHPKGIYMILVLRAATVYGTISTLWSPGSFT